MIKGKLEKKKHQTLNFSFFILLLFFLTFSSNFVIMHTVDKAYTMHETVSRSKSHSIIATSSEVHLIEGFKNSSHSQNAIHEIIVSVTSYESFKRSRGVFVCCGNDRVYMIGLLCIEFIAVVEIC